MIRSPVQKEISFLQNLVDEKFGQQPDSITENDDELRVDTVGNSAVVGNAQAEEIKTDLEKHKKGVTVNISSAKSEEKNNTWDDCLTYEGIKEKNSGGETRKGHLGDEKKLEKKMEIEKKEVVGVVFAPGSDGRDKKDRKGFEKYAIKRKRRGTKETKLTQTATGGSQSSLCSHAGNKSDLEIREETMSESSGQDGRKLSRRKQVTRPKCAGPAPSGDILQQKIEELRALIVRPLNEPRQYIHQTRQELLRLLGVSQQHAAQIMEKQVLPSGFSRGTQQSVPAELTSDISDDGYSALRAAQISEAKAAQISEAKQRRPWTATQIKMRPTSDKSKRRPFSAGYHQGTNLSLGKTHQSANSSFADIPERGRSAKRESKESSNRSSSCNVGTGETVKNNSLNGNDNEEGKSSQGSPERVIPHTDTHLKHSNNPALKKWLRQKNKEFRKQKAEERKRNKEEREKQEEAEKAKQELFKDSDKKVKEWAAQKRKEARKNAKEKRRLIRKEEEIRNERNLLHAFGTLRSKSLELSSRSQTPHEKRFIPVVRPEVGLGETSDSADQACTSHGNVPFTDTDSPHAPTSKFVYGRPVSGRVRLMKLQQRQKDDAKQAENDKKLMEENLASDKARKMRVSYDQWLLKKREEDYAKRQNIARQKALAKSDPELERIIPEIARRRIENIQRGRKKIDTGISAINDEVNKSFGGYDFGDEREQETASDQTNSKLELRGQQKAFNLRPSTAKPSLSPKESKSPRRPTSAYSQTRIVDENNGEHIQLNPFRLPFPPQGGAPKHVISKQKKLFSPLATQDKTSDILNHSDQPSDSTQKTAEPAVGTSSTTTGLVTEHENESVQDSIVDRNESRHVDDKYEPAVDEKSFFVTHGNINEASHDSNDVNFPDIEEEIDEFDNSEKLLEEHDNEGCVSEQTDANGDQESVGKFTESHHQGSNVNDKVEADDMALDGEKDDMDELEESKAAETRIINDTSEDNDDVRYVTNDRIISYIDGIEEKAVQEKRI